MEAQRIVVGAMTGTSLDGLDVALAQISGSGLAMRAKLLAHQSAPLGPLTARLRAAAEQEPLTAGAFAALGLELGQLYAHHAAELCGSAGVRPDLACIHGQTIFHRPPLSWQLINPHPVALALRCPVVFDLRGADLAEGGQGAPLTPLADWVLFRGAHTRAVVNLGGFANATILPAESGPLAAQVAAVRGRDLCACNQLLDRAARELLHEPFDRDGAAAASGTAHAEALAALTHALAPHDAPRSLGTGDEAWDCLAAWRMRLRAPDLLATLAEAIGATVGAALRTCGANEVILAGGGANHAHLAAAIAAAADAPVVRSDTVGVPASAREALAWAVLGALAQDGQRVTLPGVTGRIAAALADGLWCIPVGTASPLRSA